MKSLVRFFAKGQLEHIFILFADPHFKEKKHKWRIVSPGLLADYAYCLRPGGLLWTLTDVKQLHESQTAACDGHRLFERVPREELDPVMLDLVLYSTEEGKKEDKARHLAVYRRISEK